MRARGPEAPRARILGCREDTCGNFDSERLPEPPADHAPSRKLRSFCEMSSFQSFQINHHHAAEIPRCMRVPHARSLPRSRCTARVAPECRMSPPRSRQVRSRLSVAALRGRIRAARSTRKGIRNPHAAGGGSVDGRVGVEARGSDRRDEPVCLSSCLRRAPSPHSPLDEPTLTSPPPPPQREGSRRTRRR